MQEWAESFYLGKAWKKCRAGFMQSKGYICERCGAPATVAHHKIWLNPNNITDPKITLSWSNLEALCYDCHAIEHMAGRTRLYFDDKGNVDGVKESPEIRRFKQAQSDIDLLLQRLKEAD